MGSGRLHLRRAWAATLLLSACAITASGCGNTSSSAAGSDAGRPRHGGQVTLGMDQEPPCINTTLMCGGMAAASLMAGPLWDGMLDVDDKGQWTPKLATEVPTTANGMVTTVDGRMKVRISIKPEAHWSDDTPISCDDIVFTWKTIMDERWQVGGRVGYDKISSIDCPDERTALYTFSEPYAPYLQVVARSPLPKHDLDGKDFNTYLNDAAPVTSGPFVFGHWKRNVEYVLKRNPDYWNKGPHDLPYLDEMRFVFIKDTNTMKVQLRTGELDWMYPPPDTNLVAELKTYPRSRFQSIPGGFWEQLAFQTESGPTSDVNVRRAIAYGIDRKQLTEVVLRGQTVPLNSTLLTSMKDFHTPAFERYHYSPKDVASNLEAAGYSKQGTYFTKGGKPLTITYKSTAGNALREKVAQLLQQNFRRVGIKMDIAMELPQVFFSQSAPKGAFGIAQWAWSSGTDPQQTQLFTCDNIPSVSNQYAGNNNYRYCNREVTRLMHQADVTPDVAARSAMLKQAQELMADDVPLLPLYQRPDTVAYSNRLNGIVNNPMGGQLWNVADWWVSS